MDDKRRPDPRYYSEVYYEGPGRYAWRTRADGVQRWYRVGRPDTPLSETLSIIEQQGLMGLVWADTPDELNASYIEDLTGAAA